MPSILTLIEKRRNQHNYFVNDRPQHADWVLFEFLYDGFLMPKYAEKSRPLFEAAAPGLITWVENYIARDNRLSAYLNSRPDSDF